MTEEKQNGKRHNMFSNTAFMLRLAWKHCKSVLTICAAIALCTVALTAAEMFAAPIVLNVLESGGSLTQLLTAIAALALLLTLLRTAKEYFNRNKLYGRVLLRSKILSMIDQKAADTSYANLLDTDFRECGAAALSACGSNSAATEACWITLSELLADVLGFALYLAVLSGLDIWLTVVSTVLTAVAFAVRLRMDEWGYRHEKEEDEQQNVHVYCADCSCDRGSMKDMRIFRLSDWLKTVWDDAWEKLYRLYAQEQRHIFTADLADGAAVLLRNGFAYYVLVSRVLQGELSASEFLLYFSAISGFTAWVSGILQQVSTLHHQSIDLDKVRRYLAWPEPFRFTGGAKLPKCEHYTLRLENVSYRYPGAEKDTIHNMNLTIRPGEKLAIVGLNGAGKTTLIKLLAGFLDPTEGRVTLDGQDIRDFNRAEYYTLFTAVFQEFSLIPASIRENVAQTREGADDERVWACLDRAGLTEKVRSLPKELGTMLTREVYEDGVELSGGQTQRLMLARALYRDAPVLLLDEPTAALDPLAEAEMYEKYNEMTMGRTAIYISHRLASTRFCDRVLLLENGAIAEEGTHEELLARGGTYAELFAVQSKYYREGDRENEENGL